MPAIIIPASGVEEAFACLLMAYNFAERLKTLKGKSPYEFVRTVWAVEPERFHSDPNHFNVGLNTMRPSRSRPAMPRLPVSAPAHALRRSYSHSSANYSHYDNAIRNTQHCSNCRLPAAQRRGNERIAIITICLGGSEKSSLAS